MDTQKINSVLPFLGFIYMTINSGTTIYRAYNNGDILMIVFITFVYFGTFLLDYWFGLYHMLTSSEQPSKKFKLKIGIWILLSSIMMGFACEFSRFMSFSESLSFFGVVSGGNSLLFYVYFICEVDKSRSACSNNDSFYDRRTAVDKGDRPLTEGVVLENV